MAESGVPDVYADIFGFAVSPYGVIMTLSRSTNNPIPGRISEGEPQVIVRMSLEHAKSMAIVIRRNLKQYELEHLGDTIKLPRAVWQQMNVDEQRDW